MFVKIAPVDLPCLLYLASGDSTNDKEGSRLSKYPTESYQAQGHWCLDVVLRDPRLQTNSQSDAA